MTTEAVVLLSGGQDSTTCLFWAIREYGREHVDALIIDYGQRHRVEIARAQEIARGAGVLFSTVEVDLSESALTSPMTRARADGLPATFVPGRNLVFLALAAGVAYAGGARRVVAGANAIDYSGYPDCRPETIASMERSIQLGLAQPGFRVLAPLVDRTKAQIVRLALELGDECWAALGRSWTCYDPQLRYDGEHCLVRGYPRPCEVCAACVLRAKGFVEAGETDPAL